MLNNLLVKNKYWLILVFILFIYDIILCININPFKVIDSNGNLNPQMVERTFQDLYFRKANNLSMGETWSVNFTTESTKSAIDEYIPITVNGKKRYLKLYE